MLNLHVQLYLYPQGTWKISCADMVSRSDFSRCLCAKFILQVDRDKLRLIYIKKKYKYELVLYVPVLPFYIGTQQASCTHSRSRTKMLRGHPSVSVHLDETIQDRKV